MSTLAMEYGSSGRVSKATSNIVASGIIDDATVVDIILDVGCIYMLFTAEYNASTGAFRGEHVWVIKSPEESQYGTTAASRGSVFASQNSGVTVTNNNDSTISISRSSATYAVRYALMKIY